jgi:HAMP domain-containing protein
LLWNKDGEVFWKNFSHPDNQIDWQEAFKSLFAVSKTRKEKLSASEEENLKRIFGPHFFVKFHYHADLDDKPRLILSDSAGIFPPAWVRTNQRGGALVFVKSEKLINNHLLQAVVLNPDEKHRPTLALLTKDGIICKSELFSSLRQNDLMHLRKSYDNLFKLADLYVYKSSFSSEVIGLTAIKSEKIQNLHISKRLKLLLAIFVVILVSATVYGTLAHLFGYQFALSIRKQLVLLFLLSNAFPLLILSVLGYDYVLQYENYLKIDSLAKGATYLQSIDEMYISEFSHQLKKMNRSFAWIEERLKREEINLNILKDFLKEQKEKPFRFVFIGSHSARVGCEVGVMKDNQFIASIAPRLAKNQSVIMVIDYLNKLGKYFLSLLNKESIDDKTMLKIELVAESLGQTKPLEMVQEFFASAGYFWQWGMGKNYFPAHIRLLKLFSRDKFDYVFLYLYKPYILQHLYFNRIFHRVNRNDLGMKVIAFNQSRNMAFPPQALQNKQLKNYVISMSNKSGAETETCIYDERKHLIIGLKSNSLDRLRLLGLIPVDDITQKASKKYRLFMASGLMSLLLALALGLIVSRSFLKPLAALQSGVNALSERDFAYRLPNLGNDEFGSLAKVFNDTLIDLEELQVAAVVQKKLLPELQKEIKAGNLSIATRSLNFFNIGGDFIAQLHLDEERTAIAFGDVAGQGIATSLVMAFVKSSLLQLEQFAASPASTINKINKFITDTNTSKSRKFMSFQYILVDGERQTITIANAGHCFPIVLNSIDKQLKTIQMPSFPLGSTQKEAVKEKVIKLLPGQSLILYSAGVYRNPGLSMGLFEQLLRQNRKFNASEICQKTIDGMLAKSDKSTYNDDLSIVCIKNQEQGLEKSC